MSQYCTVNSSICNVILFDREPLIGNIIICLLFAKLSSVRWFFLLEHAIYIISFIVMLIRKYIFIVHFNTRFEPLVTGKNAQGSTRSTV